MVVLSNQLLLSLPIECFTFFKSYILPITFSDGNYCLIRFSKITTNSAEYLKLIEVPKAKYENEQKKKLKMKKKYRQCTDGTSENLL